MAGLVMRAAAYLLLGTLLLFAGYLSGRQAVSTSGAGSGPFLAAVRHTVAEPSHETASGVKPGDGRAVVGNSEDFVPERLTKDSLERLRAAVKSESGRHITSLTGPGGQEAHLGGVNELHEATWTVLQQLKESFKPEMHGKLLRAFEALEESSNRVSDALRAATPLAANRLALDAPATAATGRKAKSWSLTVTVAQTPFGMHVGKGSALVKEVFPGFPAQEAGVRPGCELREVAGEPVSSGTWLEAFQRAKVPFKLRLQCGGKTDGTAGVLGPLSEDEHRYRVLVAKKPYGMNVQVNKLPRVVEVMPGSPAEAAGVRRGFVLTEVNDVAVDADTWFKEYQAAKMPFALSFDTSVPLHEGNPFFKQTNSSGKVQDAEGGRPEDTHLGDELDELDMPLEEMLPPEEPAGTYTEFRTSVERLPFGMQVRAIPGRRPMVFRVMEGTPAEKAGVVPGDLLVEVAGRTVDSISWFAAMQQARTPYGLLLRRPSKNISQSLLKETEEEIKAEGPVQMEQDAFRAGQDAFRAAHVEDATPGDPCEFESAVCAVTRCAAPRDGCHYKSPADLKVTSDGRCCPVLCELTCEEKPMGEAPEPHIEKEDGDSPAGAATEDTTTGLAGAAAPETRETLPDGEAAKEDAVEPPAELEQDAEAEVEASAEQAVGGERAADTDG